jgi:hypothetical protein
MGSANLCECKLREVLDGSYETDSDYGFREINETSLHCRL